MKKLIAIVNVIAWSGFWAFGYLALAAEGLTDAQLVTAAVLAFAGLVTGLLAYQKLVRAAEESGYAKKTNQLDAAARNRAHQEAEKGL
ncbi:hypothetical protein [Jhaorihella thermophila]|uniref:Uncharacterized protein n=1 Tax=Jhaorihella thermophila TaxID=488547 RepID=A0A1H5VIJ0_9RHOB|nr:hypothetical protein [Jhaorihella thermophila]SEF86337.1 hypothetical protein SAMN05421751_10626 [Jhaorihella thermophila]